MYFKEALKYFPLINSPLHLTSEWWGAADRRSPQLLAWLWWDQYPHTRLWKRKASPDSAVRRTVWSVCEALISPLQRLIRGTLVRQPLLLFWIYCCSYSRPLLNALIYLGVIYTACQGSRCGQWALCFSFPSLEPLTHTACSCQPLLMYTLNFLSNLWSISAVSYCMRLLCSSFAFLFNEVLFYYQYYYCGKFSGYWLIFWNGFSTGNRTQTGTKWVIYDDLPSFHDSFTQCTCTQPGSKYILNVNKF